MPIFPSVLRHVSTSIDHQGRHDGFHVRRSGRVRYKCKEFSPGVRSVASAQSEHYYNRRASPYLDEIVFFGIPDASARVNALLSGDVD